MTSDPHHSAWDERPLLLRVLVPGSAEDLVLAQPQGPAGPGAITVLCGINATGKTTILRDIMAKIGRLARNPPDTSGVQITLTRPIPPGAHAPRTLSFISTATNKEKSGGIDLALERRGLNLPGDIVNYRLPMLEFFRRELTRRFSEETIAREDWLADVARRKSFAQRLSLEHTVYSADPEDPFVAGIESVLGVQLFYRRSKGAQLELVKRTGDGALKVYSQWSEGEKATFHITGMILLERPDLVLLDEIENHLHPGLISGLLAFLRDRVPQSLIATHHPHVIFSEWVDRVVYIDAPRAAPGVDRPDEIAYTSAMTPVPLRHIVALNDDFDRLTKAYTLFSKQDARLLEQAALVKSSATVQAAEALRDSLVPAGSARVLDAPDPDHTSTLSSRVLRTLFPRGMSTPRVLDLGAGIVRVAVERTKLGPWSPPKGVEWWAWTPSSRLRTELERAATLPHVRVIGDLARVAPRECPVAIIANVLHELVPEDAVELLGAAYDKVLSAGGTLLVSELYPLLVPQKFAVPYPSTVLWKILDRLGLQCSEEDFSVRGSRAYQLTCRADRPLPDFRASLLRALKQAWDELLSDACGRYHGLPAIVDVEQYRRHLSHMTTMASVLAWHRGHWQREYAADAS